MLILALRRTASGLTLILVASFILFLLIDNAGDPLAGLRNNPRISKADIVRHEKRLGLDRPVASRYAYWLSNFAKGDMGESIVKKRPVSNIIKERIPATALLMLTAFVLSAVIAIVMGTIQAVYSRKTIDHLLTIFVFIGYSFPAFLLGMMLQNYLGLWPWEQFGIRVAYTSGMFSAGSEGEIMDMLQHLVLPVLTITIIQTALWSRYQRSAVLSELKAPYVKMARAKGLSEPKIIKNHVLKNAIIPVLTVIIIDAGYLFNGAVIVESVFSWPGTGQLFYESIVNYDYPVLMGLLMLSTILVIAFNFLADILSAFLDPRIRYE